ncbi:MAG: serine/threonine protein kinase [Peptococcaceae bacterium]|nr:serine/threonine protein kinase [Peptococcaceae bacterium]
MSNNIKKYEPLWGIWHIDSYVGSGSFGKVYKIYRKDSGQTSYAAVKIVSIPYDDTEIQQMRSAGFDNTSMLDFSQAMVKRIIDEINLTNEVHDDHILTYNDISVHEKNDGLTLDVLLLLDWRQNLPDAVKDKTLTDADVVQLGKRICRALAICQKQGAVHLNIKPENIFVSPNGDYSLGDLGLARPLETDMSALAKRGVYTYMAPEVFVGDKFDIRSDLYSLGITLYSLLNRNRAPFQPHHPYTLLSNDAEKALNKRIGGEPIPDLKHICPELNALVQKACAFKPEDRFANPAEMTEALETAAAAIEAAGPRQLLSDTNALVPEEELPPPEPKVVQPRRTLLVKQALRKQLTAFSKQAKTTQQVLAAHLASFGDFIKINGKMLLKMFAGFIGAASIICGYFLAVHYFSPTAEEEPVLTSSAPLEAESWLEPAFVTEQDIEPEQEIETIVISETLKPAISVPDQEVEPIPTEKEEVPNVDTTPSQGPVVNASNRDITSIILSGLVKNERIPPDVTKLSLSGNRITSVSSLQSLTHLTELDISNNSILDISPLRFLTELTDLNASQNTIYSIPSGISSLTSLKRLDLSNNGIVNISPLQTLTSLEYLNLNNNRIMDISPLQSLTNLQYLHLDNNYIMSLSSLYSLTNLKELHLNGNPSITSVHIRGFKKAVPGCTVYINNTQV